MIRISICGVYIRVPFFRETTMYIVIYGQQEKLNPGDGLRGKICRGRCFFF